MTSAEFNQWLAYHQAAFPEIASWMRNMDGTGAPDDVRPTPQRIAAQWARALEDVTLDEAKAATDRMFREPDLHPKSFSAHATAVRLIAIGDRPPKTERPWRANAQWRGARCRQCLDRGVVFVISPSAVGGYLEGIQAGREPWEGVLWGEMGVACSCSAGEQWLPSFLRMLKTDDAAEVTYDAHGHGPILEPAWSWQAKKDAVAKWIAERVEEAKANRYEEWTPGGFA